MSSKEDIMIKDLERAKNELKRKQESVKWSVNNDINFSCFERNMISELTYMIELKEKIRTLELYLQYK